MTLALGDDQELLSRTVRAWCDAAVQKGARRDGVGADGWAEIVEMGWLGIDDLGDLAVVVEEVGRAGIGGPFLPTVIAAAAARELGRDDVAERLAGGATAAVAFGPGVTLGGADVDVVLAHGEAGWELVDARTPTGAVEPATGVDLGRAVGRLASASTAPPIGDRVLGVAAVLLSAEAVGLASWCLETAAAYAAQRVQFGRPVGQFQGVKHKLADALCVVEQSRAAVWDACRGGDDDELGLAIACAAALAPAAAVHAAKDCIQVLGGIGFTWEHDAHLFLRRALATRALLPPAAAWRAAAVGAVRAGVARRREVALPVEADAIRAEVRAWVDSLLETPRKEWNERLAADGYLVAHWPRPWGRGAGSLEQLVIDQELRRAGVQRPHLQVAAWALPTLIAHGTAEQQERWMGPSLRREITWCQLFSEPEAGSDLASLRTRAVRAEHPERGSGWSLTGQKVWTSMADSAHWGICLARTSPDKPPHEGITCFFVDMATPGIDIRPLRELTGEAWFNEVFLDDVFVPDDCVIGAVDDGWRVGRTTLANERVAMGSGASIGAGVVALVGLLGDERPDAVDVDRVGALVVAEHGLGALRTRTTLRALAGADAGPEASVLKLLGVLHDQDVQEAGVELLGAVAATADGEAAGWVRSFLWNRCLSIAGGTSEIQRNVIAERLLGLPKDP